MIPPSTGVRITVWERLEQIVPRLLVLTLILWIVAIFAASVFKYETLGQGYDQVDFEQAIWNTTQGRIAEDSRFNFTGSVFGMDWMPMLLYFVPFYALLSSAHTLFFLQIVGAALGVIPVYWLARDRLGSKLIGYCASLVFLLDPTLLHTVLNPFQVRLFSVTLLLFGFYYFERAKWPHFAAFALLAMLARTDVSLVVAMFGLYGLLTKRHWPYVVPPLVAGLAYFALSTFIIVPSFAYPGALSGGIGEVGMSCWPCGINPILAYYGHLGSSGGEIIAYILTHPFEVAGLMLTGEKVGYMFSLLVPFLFLPLMSPRPLVLGLPILALNLLSVRPAQYDVEHHYSLLLIPGLIIAAIYGAETLYNLVASRLPAASESKIQNRGAPWTTKIQNRLPYGVRIGAIVCVAWALAMQLPYKNPAVRAFLYPEPPERVRAALDLISMVPPDAKVAASSKLAPRLLPRRFIYNFPPAPYSPYNFGPRRSPLYVDLDYILVDPKASALGYEENKISEKTGLELLRELPDWTQVNEREGFILFQRR